MRTGEIRFLLLGSVLCLLAACAAPKDAPEATSFKVWPAPPDPPRYVYEAQLRDSRSIRVDSEDERLRRAILGTDDASRTFGKAFGVAARGGRIYVTDTEKRVVHAFDVPRRRFFTFGYRREGTLKKPAGIAVDASGNVYVTDQGARRVVKYDALGLYLEAFGGPEDLLRPTGVAVSADGARVYVVDTAGVDSERHRVLAYDGAGRRLFAIGTRGGKPGEFNLPVDAAMARDGTLYVLDSGNFRVQAFDSEGRFLRAFGSVGAGPGQFSRPRGIGVDPDGNVYVSDAWFGNVQVFDPQGRLLLAIGARERVDGPGHYRLPAGIAVDETRRVYIVDQYFHKVEVLRRLGDAESRRIAERVATPR